MQTAAVGIKIINRPWPLLQKEEGNESPSWCPGNLLHINIKVSKWQKEKEGNKMKISTKTYYGLRAMVNIANKDEVTPTTDIAYEEDISESFLEKIMSALVKKGLVESRRGVLGGYVLAKKPDKISVYDIFQALDEEIIISFCPSGNACPHSTHCGTKGFLGKLEDSVVGNLKNIKLAELI